MDDNWVAAVFFLMFRVFWTMFTFVIGLVVALFRVIGNRKQTQRFSDVLARARQDTPSLRISMKRWSRPKLPLWVAFAAAALGIVLILSGIRISLSPSDSSGPTLFFFGLCCTCIAVAVFYHVSPTASDEQADTTNPADLLVRAPSNGEPVEASSPFSIYTLRLPGSTPWQPARALQLMEHLLDTFDHLVFRIVATHHSIVWQVTDLAARPPALVEHAIRVSYPEVEIECHPIDVATMTEPFYRYLASYTQPNQFVMPLLYVTDIKKHDPLTALSQAMNNVRPGERIVYTLIVAGKNVEAYKEGQALITQSTIHPLQLLSGQGRADALNKKLSGQDRTEKYVPEVQRVMEQKLQQKLYQASLFVQVESPDQERLLALFVVSSQIVLFDHMPFNGLRPNDAPLAQAMVYVDTPERDVETSALGRFSTLAGDGDTRQTKAQRRAIRLILEPRELAALWHLPHQWMSASCIEWTVAGQVEMPTLLAGKQDGVCLGDAKYQGRLEPIYMRHEDRDTHLNIVGRTGVGKSTLMYHLIRQDIARGAGVVVIDPHGTLVKSILQTCIPENREEDVIVLDLANSAYPPPLNPLRGPAISQVLGVIERLFPDTQQYARLSMYLRAAFGTIQADPQATLRDISRVLRDNSYRNSLLAHLNNDDILDTWEEYAPKSEADKRQIREPILSRLSPFTANLHLYPVVCHPDTIDFTTYIEQRKIMLISLKMREVDVPQLERNVLGALLISRLQMSGMEESDERCYVYIDEVEKFQTTSLDVMFTEARKFGLSLTVAHQFLGQLPEKTLLSILGNAGATILFQGSPPDARSFAPYVRPQFQPDDVVNLNKHQAIVKMQYQGNTQPAFTLHTLPPTAIPHDGAGAAREQYLRDLSVQNYTPKSRETVMAWLNERYITVAPPVSGNVVGVKANEPGSSEDSAFYDKK